jgi:hypothetical protein
LRSAKKDLPMAAEARHEGVRQNLLGEELGETAEHHRLATANRMASLAAAANHAAADLGEEFPRTARYVEDTAAGFEHIASLLRDPHLDDVATLIGDFRQCQAVAIVAGATLLGVGLWWLLIRPAGPADRTTLSTVEHAAGSDGPY